MLPECVIYIYSIGSIAELEKGNQVGDVEDPFRQPSL